MTYCKLRKLFREPNHLTSQAWYLARQRSALDLKMRRFRRLAKMRELKLLEILTLKDFHLNLSSREMDGTTHSPMLRKAMRLIMMAFWDLTKLRVFEKISSGLPTHLIFQKIYTMNGISYQKNLRRNTKHGERDSRVFLSPNKKNLKEDKGCRRQ